MIEAAIGICAIFGVVGFATGYMVCSRVLGDRIDHLELQIVMMSDRDEKGRFVKSMGKLDDEVIRD